MADPVCGCEVDPAYEPKYYVGDYEKLRQWVSGAAAEVLRRIVERNEGSLPVKIEQWISCCRRFNVVLRPLHKTPTFTALLVGARGDNWWIFYNALASGDRQARYIAHELAEYITREESWHIDPPVECSSVFADEVRHLIARDVESLVARADGAPLANGRGSVY